MRKMADSVDAANLPVGFDLYAAYVDGHYANYQAVVARFGAKVIPIAVFSSTNSGIVGDCETGDMTPQTAVSWVEMRRRAGVDPTIYCSESAWPAVKQAFTDAHVPEPHWWIAGYPGSVGQNLYPGSIAHQWIDRGPYDESVVADYWPGFDPPQSTKENPMLIAATPDAKGYICVKPNGAVYAYGDAKYHGGIDNAGANGTSALAAGDAATGVVYAITDAAPQGGYWISTAQGHVYAFGGLPYLGAP